MRTNKLRLLTATLAIIVFAAGTTPALAQDILGLSMRATEAMPEGTSRGLADIVDDGDGYAVSLDLSSAADALNLDDFDGAEAFVLWAVDMDGVRHNIGVLGDDGTLEDASVDFLIARLYVTAESDSAANQPTGDPLFLVTLRSVEEVDTVAEEDAEDADEAASEAADDTDEGEAATDEAKPAELPTTGQPMRDLLVLLAMAGALLAGGLKLRSSRI